MENITSRYTYGHEEYTITDSSFEGEIKLTFTRSNETDAMLVKAELPDELTDKLVVATVGQGSINVSEPTEGNGNKLEFDYTNTQGRTISVDNNMFVIGNNGSVTTKDSELNNVIVPTDITGTSNVDMHYTTRTQANTLTVLMHCYHQPTQNILWLSEQLTEIKKTQYICL